jgi:2-methylisocitrate lyase-like PEP mutase family enzyme
MLDTEEIRRRGARLQTLHAGPEILVVPNPWDRGTARLLANLGFQALATTSAGFAFSLGRRDGDGAVSADETFQHCAELVEATALPVTADLENGFGDSPEDVARTIARAGAIGLAGGSIEDATYSVEAPLFERALAVERVHAGVEAARALGRPFVFTARTEGFIRGRPDLDETLRRVEAFEKAGADVLYAPGLPDEASLRRVCQAVSKPVNFVAGIGKTSFSLAQLKDIGVRRVSIGGSMARVAFDAVARAGREILEKGTFSYAVGVPGVAAFNELISPAKLFTDRR